MQNMALVFGVLTLCSNFVHGHEVGKNFRGLEEYSAVAGYMPKSLITDNNAIDLDQGAMEAELAFGTPDAYELARTIYMEGGNSKSYAAVTLDDALDAAIAKGTVITGETEAGGAVQGKALHDVMEGATEIHVQYDITADQTNHVSCRVGGLSDETTIKPQYDGCFANTGSLNVNGESLSYSYDMKENNDNAITLAGFSINAEEKMYLCDTCPFPDYEIFFKYYGQYDYGHQYIMASLDKSETDFTNGNADFSSYDYDGRTQIIKKAAAYMNTLMYSIREMEKALDICSKEVVDNSDSVHSWDKAVTYYTGSKEGEDGSGSGKMSYALADKRCTNFRTCGGENVGSFDFDFGPSRANTEIFQQFKQGQENIVNGDCAAAKINKEKITRLYQVPNIQGTLRYSYIQYTEQFGDKQEAEGTVFMASVIPYVHKCNETDAKIIYDETAVGGNTEKIDFPAIKAAFERNYECMGLTCEEVGGIYKKVEEEYYDDTKPCDFVETDPGTLGAKSDDSAGHHTLSSTFLLSAVVVLVALIV